MRFSKHFFFALGGILSPLGAKFDASWMHACLKSSLDAPLEAILGPSGPSKSLKNTMFFNVFCILGVFHPRAILSPFGGHVFLLGESTIIWEKGCEITCLFVVSSSARAGFREATGIRRAPTAQRRRRALFGSMSSPGPGWDVSEAWLRLFVADNLAATVARA